MIFVDLLPLVLVLAADLRLSPDGELASPAQVVTFALKNEDLLKVNLAKELGILSLSLRKLNDESISDTEKITGDKLGRSEEKETPPVVVAVASFEAAVSPNWL